MAVCWHEEDRAAAEWNSVNRIGGARGFASRLRSEFIAQTNPDCVDVGIDRGGKADVFPLRPQEQARYQLHIHAQACGIAVNEVAVFRIRRNEIARYVPAADSRIRLDLVPHKMGGPDNDALSKRP